MSSNTGSDLYEQAHLLMSNEDPDLEKVFQLLCSSFDCGSPDAAYALGTWYMNGRHVETDEKKAVEYYEVAAKNNIGNACYDLAVCREKGIGVKKDLHQAAVNYLRGAILGELSSIYEVGRCYYFGIGVKKDEEVGQIWIDRARYLGFED